MMQPTLIDGLLCDAVPTLIAASVPFVSMHYDNGVIITSLTSTNDNLTIEEKINNETAATTSLNPTPTHNHPEYNDADDRNSSDYSTSLSSSYNSDDEDDYENRASKLHRALKYAGYKPVSISNLNSQLLFVCSF